MKDEANDNRRIDRNEEERDRNRGAVALVLLAVPTIAFANGMQQTWCPSGGAGSLAHHAMRAAGDSDAGRDGRRGYRHRAR